MALLAIFAVAGCEGVAIDAAPLAEFLAWPEMVAVGEFVTFDASASSDDSAITKYSWDFDGDGDTDLESYTPSPVQYAYDAPGWYEARLTVVDDSGQESTTVGFVEVLVGSATLDIEFGEGVTGDVQVFIDDEDVRLCVETCSIETYVGAHVELVPHGNIELWTDCDEDLGTQGCLLTMDGDRTVRALVRPPS